MITTPKHIVPWVGLFCNPNSYPAMKIRLVLVTGQPTNPRRNPGEAPGEIREKTGRKPGGNREETGRKQGNPVARLKEEGTGSALSRRIVDSKYRERKETQFRGGREKGARFARSPRRGRVALEEKATVYRIEGCQLPTRA